MKLLLELFCGTKSVSKALDSNTWEVISLDINPKFVPTICIDFLDWDYTSITSKVDCIWASPDCSCFSIASGGHHFSADQVARTDKARKSLQVIFKLKECIKYFIARNPNMVFYVENPRARLRWFMGEYPRYTYTYCQFGFNRMKPTDIWSNNQNIESKCCKNGAKCHLSAPRGAMTSTQGMKKEDKYKIPPNLVKYLFHNLN